MFDSYLLFFFAGLGAFNGVTLWIYLLLRRPFTPAHGWLAALVLMLSLRTGKSVVFYFWPEVSKLVLQVGLTACFLIGPSLVGFVRAWADPQRQRTRRDPLYAAALLVLAVGLGLLYPYSVYPDLWRGPVWLLIQCSWLACLPAAGMLLVRAVPQPEKLAADGLTQGHAGAVVAGVAVVWLAYVSAGLTSYIVGALSFSVVLYLAGIVGLARRKAAPAALQPYHDRKIAADEAESDLQALHKLMAEEQLYRDASLSLPKVARRLNMAPARLSQLLNDNLKTAFKPYLAQLRIEAAKALLCAPEPVPMEQVAEAAGFLSMSTFYSSFRKAEGTTPAVWRKARQTPGDAS